MSLYAMGVKKKVRLSLNSAFLFVEFATIRFATNTGYMTIFNATIVSLSIKYHLSLTILQKVKKWSQFYQKIFGNKK
jgi:hypothetical protein